MKKTIAILGSALLLAAFPAQAQQPQSGSAAQDTEQAAPLSREELMRIAIRLSEENVAAGGGPFGAVIARDGQGRRHRCQPGHARLRPHGTRRGERHPRRSKETGHVRPERLRNLHLLRTVPDVPRGDLLGAAGSDVLRQRQATMPPGSVRRCVHLPGTLAQTADRKLKSAVLLPKRRSQPSNLGSQVRQGRILTRQPAMKGLRRRIPPEPFHGYASAISRTAPCGTPKASCRTGS